MKNLLAASLVLILWILWWVAAAPDIGDVVVRFCDNPSQLEREVSYEVEPNEVKEVCLKLINEGFEDMDIEISFVDGTFTNDEKQHKACKTSGADKNFAQFAEIFRPDVRVPARGAVEKTFSLTYPEWFVGNSNGCVITKLKDTNHNSPDEMFDIEIRRGNFIDVFVNWEIVADLAIIEHPDNSSKRAKNKKIYTKSVSIWGKMFSSVMLENAGNVTQTIEVARMLKPSFGKDMVDTVESRSLLPGEQLIAGGNLPKLAWYQKGFVRVSYVVFHQPIFSFDSDAITEDMKSVQQLYTETWVFVFPIEIVIVLWGLLLLLLMLLYFSHKKFHNWTGFHESFVKNGPHGPKTTKGKKVKTTKRQNGKTEKKTTKKKKVASSKSKSATATKKVSTKKKDKTTKGQNGKTEVLCGLEMKKARNIYNSRWL